MIICGFDKYNGVMNIQLEENDKNIPQKGDSILLHHPYGDERLTEIVGVFGPWETIQGNQEMALRVS